MPMWMNIYTQDSCSSIMEHMKFFHDHAMIVIISLSVMFSFLMMSTIYNKKFNHFYLESQLMEFFWTFAPSLMLMFLAIPSMKMLYLLEEQIKPYISIKVTGYQWFWGYEYFSKTGEKTKMFEANLLKTNKNFKLLETSNNILIPYMTPVRFLITSKDVIHSWSMPSVSIKVDAVPGRINQTTTSFNRTGIFVGQCSEICGYGHSFMPIFIESLKFKNLI